MTTCISVLCTLGFVLFVPALPEQNPIRRTLHFPSTGFQLLARRFAQVDDLSLPLKNNLRCTLSKPVVRPEPVLTPSRNNPNASDRLAAHFYGTILFDQDKFRMWYYACHTRRNPDCPDALKAQAERWKEDVFPGSLCYAESVDGLHWEEPNLPQLLFKGSRDNNALALPSALTGDACVIKDEDGPDPTRRYKLAYWSQFGPYDYPTMRLAISNDGLAFREPGRGHVWLRATDSPATPVPRRALPPVLCQANGILNVGDETRIYHGRWRNSHYGKEGTSPEDYWGRY